MFFDPMYLAIALPAILLSMYASYLTNTRFQIFSRVPASSGLTGAQAARHGLLGGRR